MSAGTINPSTATDAQDRLAIVGTRGWAALGNLLRVVAVVSLVVFALAVTRVSQWLSTNPPSNLVTVVAIVGAIELLFAVLMWVAKGPLVSGNIIVRVLAAIYFLLWIVSTLGLAVLFFGIAYLFTGEPDIYRGIFAAPPPPKPTFAPPVNWRPTGRVGPSGAMLYSDAEQESAVGVFASYVPVQVLDRRNGLAHVMAASGEGGWIDLRQLTEGA